MSDHTRFGYYGVHSVYISSYKQVHINNSMTHGTFQNSPLSLSLSANQETIVELISFCQRALPHHLLERGGGRGGGEGERELGGEEESFTNTLPTNEVSQ